MKKIKPILKIFGWLIAIIVLYLAGVIIYGTITDYKPEPGSTENLQIKGKATPASEIDSVITLMTWNLGYGGLGKEMDFFYDGGKTVRAPKNLWDKDFKGIRETIRANDSIDFILIQEIDRNSKRSYEVDQFREVNHDLQGFSSAFALNYNVKYVPVPYTNPMGKVYGGVATFSKYAPAEAIRYQYPGKFPWPTRIFFLDRCFIAERYPLKSGKELIIINTHNSAYDETGEVKDAEMNFLKEFAMAEFKKGNYVIAGGDWNQCPPGFDIHTFQKGEYNEFIPPAMSFDYFPEDWLWAYDPYTPTNRHVEKPLDENTFKTLIDFYLLSPNIQLIKIKTQNLNFENSDHQPVLMSVKMM